ncbi:helix-turn-helix domain-containing protein [Entomomonas sp. E2T0]|uniref:helix-turn-helix domain-containing protein n=1 Tax=Entomomonas sp. E2T0 TaxID=2930213 RepID=UPI0022281AB2|nr:helix-turn-helix domain-containing protein [Entomomonas sp. E2T0]UYZ82842.1 helix-turn-helix domain-containing protein [Entomomonas sp. E2T0]
MKIASFKASAHLQPYINRYWVWEGEQELPTMLPGTGAELIFQYASSTIEIQSNHTHTMMPRGVLLQPRFHSLKLVTESRASFMAVRFRHGALRHFCKHSLADLVDQPISVSAIWGEAGNQLVAHMQETTTIAQRIALLNDFLLKQLQIHHKQQLWLDKAINQLYYSLEPLAINSISEQLSLSTRYFQKKFKENYGVTAKYFQCVTRFEKTLRQLLLTKESYYLDTALAHGYYDQAHFIKQFKQFTQTTPLNYLQEKNFRTHFYNKSL